MAKLDEGFTIKLQKKGSNKMLLPMFAVFAFLFVSIAFGMYVYEPAKDIASTNKVSPIVNEVHQASVDQPNNIPVEKSQNTKNVLTENKTSNNSNVIENKNTNIVQETNRENSVREFKQVLNFDFDSTEIKAYDDKDLQKFLADNKDKKFKIIIDGHTDSIGATDYNQGLSERRASSVEQELVKMTSPQSDITKTITGYGETKPVDSNDSSEGRAHNRRVELTIIVLP